MSQNALRYHYQRTKKWDTQIENIQKTATENTATENKKYKAPYLDFPLAS